LNLVRKLKEQYLPLEEIRDTMQRLTLDEVDDLLAQSSQTRGDVSPTTSASEYITSVLNQTAIREEMKRKASPPPPPAGLPYPATSMPLPAPAMAPGYAPTRARPGEFEAAWETSPTQLEQTGMWRRITIAPGIELHFVQTDDALTNSIAAQILTAAQDILESNSGEFTEEIE
jgi:hypothetical protein